jgi:hypothetical protein
MRENTPPVKGSGRAAARLLLSFVLQETQRLGQYWFDGVIVVAIFMLIARPLTVFLSSVAAHDSKNSLFSVINSRLRSRRFVVLILATNGLDDAANGFGGGSIDGRRTTDNAGFGGELPE